MGRGKLFFDQSEPVTRDMRVYIEDWENFNTKKMTRELVLISWPNM